ncbi:hypothetical protein SETIT_2G160700v2 [Setaria italica]|uniref:NAD-dependent epimerase/dehydratase domain-containing protein n=1 Tax=Setaria italica TaxID=4555 RepID=A0A368PZS8_SETIT|nr:hypothetical protein SETIT_2G160700v2 [Setaria italica]
MRPRREALCRPCAARTRVSGYSRWTLLDPASGRPAVEGTRGVFHLASPFILCKQRDPEICGVGRVVLMSSQAAMVLNPNWPVDKVVDKDCCAVVELLKKVQCIGLRWEGGIAMAVLNPWMVLGPMLAPSVNTSLQLLLQLLAG